MDKIFRKGGETQGTREVIEFLRKNPKLIRDALEQIKEYCYITTAPTKIPLTKPGIEIECPNVKNLRFEFSDGKYTLKWEEGKDGEVELEKEISLTINERKPFVGGNWKSNGDTTFIDLFIHSCLNTISFNSK